MKKTLNINIAGMAFSIDEDAYDVLSTYMDKLERHFSKSEDHEILNDIEARIAELFNEKMPQGHNVVSLSMVRDVIEIMGSPEQIDDNEEPRQNDLGEKAQQFMNDAAETVKNRFSKKLYRSEDDKIIAGVMGGIANWANINAIALRLIAILLVCFGQAWVIIAYLALWFIIPEAITPSQKLEAEGEAVNVDSIRDFKETHAATPQSERSGCMSAVGFILKGVMIFFGGLIALGVIGITLTVLIPVFIGLVGALVGVICGLFGATVSIGALPFGLAGLGLPSIALALCILAAVFLPFLVLGMLIWKAVRGKHETHGIRNAAIVLFIIWIACIIASFLMFFNGVTWPFYWML